jgi:hypothetical protein
MFSNNWFFQKNGAKRKAYSDHTISYSANYNHLPNHQANPKRMETKLFLIILSWIGVGSYIGGILLNLGTWKSDTLFCLAFLFGIVKFIRYTVRTWQDFRRGEIDIKLKRKESDK